MSKKLRELVHDIQYTHDLTLEEVAKRIGRSRPYLSKVMNKEEENDEMYDLITRKFCEPTENQDAKKPRDEDLQARLISRLDDDLRELKSTMQEVLKLLTLLKQGFDSAESRQKAAFQITYFLAEELATVPRVEKDAKKLVETKRKQIEQRLVASLQEGK